MELSSGSAPTDLADLSDSNDFIDADDRICSLVVGVVIGAGALFTLCLFTACGILHCYLTRDKGNNYSQLANVKSASNVSYN